jgi:hypothetical protein
VLGRQISTSKTAALAGDANPVWIFFTRPSRGARNPKIIRHLIRLNERVYALERILLLHFFEIERDNLQAFVVSCRRANAALGISPRKTESRAWE